MEFAPVRKRTDLLRRRPNLEDYAAARAAFSWEAAAALEGLPGGALNIAHEAVDRHARGGRAGQLAMRFLAAGDAPVDYSYARLRAESDRVAAALVRLGLRPGERVATLAGRVPAQYLTALGAFKAGATFLPLFSAFGPEPIRARLDLGGARVLVTTDVLYRRKVAQIRESLPRLGQVLVVRGAPDAELPAGTRDFEAVVAEGDGSFEIRRTRPEHVALLHFTSGTTGLPKGVMHAHRAVTAHVATARLALDLQDGDRYWCTADPGWVTGVSYGLIAPLACGVSMIVDREEFDPERWYDLLAREQVSVWYTAPTAIRMLMKAGLDPVRRHEYPALRHLASVGEPLNPEAVLWGVEAFGLPFHDNWWQTETGAIMVANFPAMEVRPGSMGRPVPGVEAAVLRRSGPDVEPCAPGEVGELALRTGWPSMFLGYLGDEARTKKCFAGDWYLSGDLARTDEHGYFWFVGRADDVIKAAGHLISPFEVESALLRHPAVAQAGVIGIPDPVAGSAVKAFVELKPGFDAGEPLRREVLAHARRLLGAAVAPREIAFAEQLPRTRSGKIMRRLLRARELGLPEGDLSTLEAGA